MSNIFDRAVKGVKDTLLVIRASGAAAKEINSISDFANVPSGFFILTVKGNEMLAYKFPPSEMNLPDEKGKIKKCLVQSPFGHVIDVAPSFRHPGIGETIKLNIPRKALPVFKMNLRQNDGVVIGGRRVIDTAWLENDGETGWAGAPPASGITWR